MKPMLPAESRALRLAVYGRSTGVCLDTRKVDLVDGRPLTTSVPWLSAQFVPAYMIHDDGGARVVHFAKEALDTSNVTLADSLARSSAAIGMFTETRLQALVHPYFSVLDQRNMVRTVDGGMWDRCGIASVLLALNQRLTERTHIKLMFCGRDKDYDLIKEYVAGLPRDPTFETFRVFASVVSGERQTLHCTMNPEYASDYFDKISEVTIFGMTVVPPTHLHMMFDETKVDAWKQFITEAYQFMHARATELHDVDAHALVTSGGGMLTATVGACGMAAMRQRLPTVLGGISGGSWATAIYFRFLHPLQDDSRIVPTLHRLIDDMAARFIAPDRMCEPGNGNTMLSLIDQTAKHLFDVHITRHLAAVDYHWEKYTDALLGDVVEWTDMAGFVVVHPFTFMTRSRLTKEEIASANAARANDPYWWLAF